MLRRPSARRPSRAAPAVPSLRTGRLTGWESEPEEQQQQQQQEQWPPPPLPPALRASSAAAPLPSSSSPSSYQPTPAPSPEPATHPPPVRNLRRRPDDGTYHQSDEDDPELTATDRVALRMRRRCGGCGRSGLAAFTCPRCSSPYCSDGCFDAHNGGACRPRFLAEAESELAAASGQRRGGRGSGWGGGAGGNDNEDNEDDDEEDEKKDADGAALLLPGGRWNRRRAPDRLDALFLAARRRRAQQRDEARTAEAAPSEAAASSYRTPPSPASPVPPLPSPQEQLPPPSGRNTSLLFSAWIVGKLDTAGVDLVVGSIARKARLSPIESRALLRTWCDLALTPTSRGEDSTNAMIERASRHTGVDVERVSRFAAAFSDEARAFGSSSGGESGNEGDSAAGPSTGSAATGPGGDAEDDHPLPARPAWWDHPPPAAPGEPPAPPPPPSAARRSMPELLVAYPGTNGVSPTLIAEGLGRGPMPFATALLIASYVLILRVFGPLGEGGRVPRGCAPTTATAPPSSPPRTVSPGSPHRWWESPDDPGLVVARAQALVSACPSLRIAAMNAREGSSAAAVGDRGSGGGGAAAEGGREQRRQQQRALERQQRRGEARGGGGLVAAAALAEYWPPDPPVPGCFAAFRQLNAIELSARFGGGSDGPHPAALALANGSLIDA